MFVFLIWLFGLVFFKDKNKMLVNFNSVNAKSWFLFTS